MKKHPLEWREVDMPTLAAAQSTGRAEFLAPALRPPWARAMTEMSGAWLFEDDRPFHDSTSSLSPSAAQAHMDVERSDPRTPGLLKYYRYYLVKMSDGRVFQYGPIKDLEYKRHIETRPEWTLLYSSEPGRR